MGTLGVELEHDQGPGRSRILDGDGEAAGEPERERAHETQRPILCRACGQRISDRSALFAIDSERIARVFANPHGFLHEVVTVRWAEGLEVAGPATTEFSWYPGYAWEIANCAACRAHIGWAFGAVVDDLAPRSFWGLRRSQVTGL